VLSDGNHIATQQLLKEKYDSCSYDGCTKFETAKDDFYLWKETAAQRTFIKFDRLVFGLNLDVQTLARHDHFWWVRQFVTIEPFVLNRNTGEHKQPDSTAHRVAFELLKTLPRSRSYTVDRKIDHNFLFNGTRSLERRAVLCLFRKSFLNKGWSNFGYKFIMKWNNNKTTKERKVQTDDQTAVERYSTIQLWSVGEPKYKKM